MNAKILNKTRLQWVKEFTKNDSVVIVMIGMNRKTLVPMLTVDNALPFKVYAEIFKGMAADMEKRSAQQKEIIIPGQSNLSNLKIIKP